MSFQKVGQSMIKRFHLVLRHSASPLSRSYAAVVEARAVLENELDGIRTAGTWKAERVITSKQGSQISVDGSRSRKYKIFW